MDRLGIEFISTLAMNPVDAVALAAALGVTKIGMACAPITENPHNFAAWDLLKDPALVRATLTAARNEGVTISLGEGFIIMPGTAIIDAEPAVDIMAELGAPVLNCCAVEADRARAVDEFARFAEIAAARGLIATLEFLPIMGPTTLAEARDFVIASGAPNGRLLIDAMHLYRSGATTADLAGLDPKLIGYAQICDVPMPATTSDYGEEARHDRLCPGDGDLPLSEFLRALPADVTVGLEVPMVSKAKAGMSVGDTLAPCVAATRQLLG